MSNNIVKYVEGQCSLVSWILKRKRQNNNTLLLVYGQTGSGKTYAAIRKAYEVDPTFEARQVVFSFIEFMEVINSDWFNAKSIKQVIFDEPQVSMNSRNWQSVTNKLINHLLSTFRSTQVIVWFCCPYKDFIDAQSAKLIHCTLETRGIDRTTNNCRLRLNIEEYNSGLQKYYHHSLFVIRGGSYNKLREILAAMPPKDLIKDYEAKKAAFNRLNNQKILIELKKLEEKGKPKEEIVNPIDEESNDKGVKPMARKSLTDKQLETLTVIAKYKGSIKETAKNTSHLAGTLYFHQAQARKKGYSWQEFQEKEAISLENASFKQ